MTLLIKFALIACLANASKSVEIYSDYSKNYVYHFDRWFDDCPDFNNTDKIRNVQISGNKTNMVASLLYEVQEDYPSKFGDIFLDIERCASKEAPDTCVKLTTLKADRVCIMMEAKDQFFTTVFNCLTPTFDCPPKKGVYNGKGCHFAMTRFNWFPIPSNYYYKIRYVGVNKRTNDQFFCYIFAGKLERKRNME